jgi:DNA polymerase (family 10)
VSPFHQTLEQLALLARMRGDVAEAALWRRAIDLVRASHIESDADAGPLFDNPPAGSDPEVLKRLRQMYEAGGWVLVESAIADLPADLRWLFESGAVTIEQLAELHLRLGVTSAADIAAALDEHQLPMLAGFDAGREAAVAAALPTLRSRIARIPLGRAVAIAEAVLEPVRDAPGVAWAMPVGSLRRGEDTVGDI